MRKKSGIDYMTATLKLDENMMKDFENILGARSKNNYIVDLVNELVMFFTNASEQDKIHFAMRLAPYASKRKRMNDDTDKSSKKEVVSVKLDRLKYEYLTEEARNIGFTFSEIIRRHIAKDLEEML